MQVQEANPPQYKSSVEAALKVAQTSGLRGFYRGFFAVAAGSIPANIAYFNGYELGKKMGLGEVFVGAVAQAIGSLIFTPVDVMKERMQVQGIRGIDLKPDGPYRVFVDLIKERGPIGLLRGYWMTNTVWIPWNMLYMPLYEESKRQCMRFGGEMGKDGELHPVALIVCSAISASIAAVATHPLDIIKTRYQVSKEVGGRGGSVSSIALELWQREGVRALTRGLSARILTLAPGTAISWAVYEPIKRALS